MTNRGFVTPTIRDKIPVKVFPTAGFIGTSDLPALRDRAGLAPLSWLQVREMASHSIEVGAHTLSVYGRGSLPPPTSNRWRHDESAGCGAYDHLTEDMLRYLANDDAPFSVDLLGCCSDVFAV